VKRVFIFASFILAAAACRPEASHLGRTLGIEAYASARDLHRLAETYRAKHKLPALGIGIIHRGRIVGLGMAGERSAGSKRWATIDDVFDLGSVSKSVTATIAALLVEQQKIRWNTTVADSFPELRGSMHAGYAHATLEQLLRHRAGLDHEMNRNSRWAAWHQERADKSPTEQRLLFAAAALRRPPRYPPGTDSYYCSDGYLVAGSMLERASGVDWETLVRTRLFEPLGLDTMSHGMISRRGAATQVAGHEPGWFGATGIVPPNPAEYGVKPWGAPAGFLFGSVPDLLRYVDFHIQGENGNGRLLRQESFQRLHAKVGTEPFALGWEIEIKRGARGEVVDRSIYHGGYSGRFRANLWFNPDSQWGTAIVTNHGRGDDAITADIFYALLREFRLLPAASAAR